MHEFNLDISERSVWNTATPTAAAVSFPFYITEAGHFYAGDNYYTTRSDHDSYVLIYTIAGTGRLETDGSGFILDSGSAVIIDCRALHSYRTEGRSWEFLWIHLNGAAADTLFRTLYPDGVHPITAGDTQELRTLAENCIDSAGSNDIASASDISASIHNIFNLLIKSELHYVRSKSSGRYSDDIARAEAYIKEHYPDDISIDDIVDILHISKYHFIRIFKRVIGVTPYAYLMNCRINRSKLLLRSSDMSIGDISLACGFADASNFIVQFKKHTGQKPTSYREMWR